MSSVEEDRFKKGLILFHDMESPYDYYNQRDLICEYEGCIKSTRKYVREFDLVRHIERKHLQEKEIKCRFCCDFYPSRERFEKHLLKKHNVSLEKSDLFSRVPIISDAMKDALKYVCGNCGFQFHNENFEMHKITCEPVVKNLDCFLNGDDLDRIHIFTRIVFMNLQNVSCINDFEKLKVIGNTGVYGIYCVTCMKIYIGSTGNLKQRTKQHRADNKLDRLPSMESHRDLCTQVNLSPPILLLVVDNFNVYRNVEKRVIFELSKVTKTLNLFIENPYHFYPSNQITFIIS
jgi:GIY-YIG catalytic domain